MKCPNDDSVLVMSERSGIEIDFCPTCRGVWLDRGELDKIIERSFTAPAASAPPRTQVPQPSRDYDYDSDRDRDRDRDRYSGGNFGLGGLGSGQDQHGRKRKKESWLSELFD